MQVTGNFPCNRARWVVEGEGEGMHSSAAGKGLRTIYITPTHKQLRGILLRLSSTSLSGLVLRRLGLYYGLRAAQRRDHQMCRRGRQRRREDSPHLCPCVQHHADPVPASGHARAHRLGYRPVPGMPGGKGTLTQPPLTQRRSVLTFIHAAESKDSTGHTSLAL